MSTALAEAKRPELAVGNSVGAIVPRDVEQAFRMAQLIVHAGMAPNGMNSPEKVVTAIMHGMEVGLKPMQAIQSIAIVNGRPTIWGDAALGLVQGSGLAEYVVERVEGDGEDMVAICETKRHGWPSPVVGKFSVADAKLAGLWGKAGPWKQYPRRMLQMRARGFALRDAFADVLKGLSVREETRDFLMARDVTPMPARDLAAELAEQSDMAPVREPEAEIEIDDAPLDDDTHDPETGEIDAPDDPTDWNAWSKSMAARIDACETVEALAELQTDNNGKLGELGRAKPKWATALNERFGTRFHAIEGSEGG